MTLWLLLLLGTVAALLMLSTTVAHAAPMAPAAVVHAAQPAAVVHAAQPATVVHAAPAAVVQAAPLAPAAPGGPTAPATPTSPADGSGGVTVQINGADGAPSSAVVTLIGITLLSVAPALLLMMTSFTKIFVVLAMTRNALGAAEHPAQPGAGRAGAVPVLLHHGAGADGHQQPGACSPT